MTDLKSQTLGGVFVLGGATLGLRTMSIISSIILARLLDPADFGFVSLASIVLSTTSLFSGLGMGLAVLHSQADLRKIAHQAFVATAISGTIFCSILLVSAPAFASFLGNHEVVPIIRAMAPLVLLGALATVPDALLLKDLMFSRVSATSLTSELLSIAVAVPMAFLGFGVWSLVASSLVRGVANFAVLMLLLPNRVVLRPQAWDWEIMRGLLTYGLQTMGGGLVSFFNSILDNFIVGRKLGATSLGWYSRAYDYTTRSVDSFMTIVATVLFPSYAKMQGDLDKVSRTYLKSLRLVSFVTVPVSLGLLVTATETIPTLLGEKWVPMIPAFIVLCGVSLVKTFSGTTGALFASIGRPAYNLRAGTVVLAVMIPTILVLLPWGITGVAVALLVTHILGLLFNMHQASLVFDRAAARMLRAVSPSLVGGGVLVGVVTLAKVPLAALLGGVENIPSIVLMVATGTGVYGAFLWWQQRELVRELATLTIARMRQRRSSGSATKHDNNRETGEA